MSDSKAYYRFSNGDEFTGEFRNNHPISGTKTKANDGKYFIGSFSGDLPYCGSWYNKNGKKIDNE